MSLTQPGFSPLPRTMLKRKRSASELLCSPSSSIGSPASMTPRCDCGAVGGSSSPPTSPCSVVSSTCLHRSAAPHLPSRTLKRFRNDRPCDQEVHQRTLSLLYSAQQQRRQRCSSPPQVDDAQTMLTAPPPAQARSGGEDQHTLHRFWSINSAPAPTSPSLLLRTDHVPSGCDDCRSCLQDGEGDSSHSMDLDDFGPDATGTACGVCGKSVCFSCSVSNLGENKRCLRCAGRKVHVSGIGWPNAVLSVI